MNIKIKKKLGHGYEGTVYLSEVNKTRCITKIEKHDETPQSSYTRQVKFNEIAKKNPDHLMTILFHGILEDCKETLPLPKTPDKKVIEKIKEKNKLDKCSVICYTPVLDFTLRDVKEKLTDKQYVDALHQVMETCLMLKRHKARHRDIHDKNIMGKASSNTLQWYLIDYGTVFCDGFQRNNNDKQFDWNNDIISTIWAFAINPIMKQNKIKFPPFNTFLKRIRASPVFPEIEKWLPATNDKFILGECTALLAMIIDYKTYAEALGTKNNMVTQRFPQMLLNIIKNINKNFLRYIKN